MPYVSVCCSGVRADRLHNGKCGQVEDAGPTLASDGPQHVSLHSKALRWQSQKDRVDAMDNKEPINSLMMPNPAAPVARKFLQV